MLKTLLVSSLLFAVATPAGAADTSKHKPTTVRFLCVAPATPTKFKRISADFYEPIPFGFDDLPPSVVALKQGDSYKTVPFVPEGVSGAMLLTEKGHSADAGFYFQGGPAITVGESVSRAHEGASGPSKTKPAPGAKTEKTESAWHQLAPCPKPDGKDHLICLFNPDAKGKWYPNKSLDLDISETVFPIGHCLVLNLSLKQIIVQVGEKTKPIVLAPGESSFVQSKPGSDDTIRIKAAAVEASSQAKVVYNRNRPFPHDRRTVVVFFEPHPTLKLTVDTRTFQIRNDAPVDLTEEKPAHKR